MAGTHRSVEHRNKPWSDRDERLAVCASLRQLGKTLWELFAIAVCIFTVMTGLVVGGIALVDAL